ncbi:MAG: dTDP-4-dehydrorhamnose 3,5-epimerase family protein [bacterium]
MINGVKIIELKKKEDARGWLAEIYRKDEINYQPVMSYVSVTKPGVIRGPHEHKKQADFFVFLGSGKFRLYLWDNRPDSLTYQKQEIVEAGEDNPMAVLVPAGVVHGYKCISEIPGWCINLPDKLYKGEDKKEEVDEIRWENDPNSPFKIE